MIVAKSIKSIKKTRLTWSEMYCHSLSPEAGLFSSATYFSSSKRFGLPLISNELGTPFLVLLLTCFRIYQTRRKYTVSIMRSSYSDITIQFLPPIRLNLHRAPAPAGCNYFSKRQRKLPVLQQSPMANRKLLSIRPFQRTCISTRRDSSKFSTWLHGKRRRDGVIWFLHIFKMEVFCGVNRVN